MAKKNKVKYGVGINFILPEQFSYELDQYLLDLKTVGIRKSKSQYIIELAQRAFLQEKVNKL